MTKDFLPKSKHDALIENGQSPERRRALQKCCPLLGIFIIFMGSAFLGFSFVIVPSEHVGYYPCTSCNEVKTCTAGLYLELPWKKGEMKITNISPRNLTLGNVSYTRNNTELNTGLIEITFMIYDLNLYLRTLSAFKIDTLFQTALIADVIKNVVAQFTTNVFAPFNLYGIKFDKIHTII